MRSLVLRGDLSRFHDKAGSLSCSLRMLSYWPVLGTATGEQEGGTSPEWSCSSLFLLGSAGWQKSRLSLLPAMFALESVGAGPPLGVVFSAAARAASRVIWFTTSSISWESPAEGLEAAGGGSRGLGTGFLACNGDDIVGGARSYSVALLMISW